MDEPHVSSDPESSDSEAWLFAGQGAFDPQLLSERVETYARLCPSARHELEQCAAIADRIDWWKRSCARRMFSGTMC